MFESLTAILTQLGKGPYATIPEQTGDGSHENPYIMPHYIYKGAARDLIHESMRFADEHEELNLSDYEGIMRAAGIRLEREALKKADVSSLDGKMVMAMIAAVVRMERFCDGVLREFCEDGCIQRWLERLKEIDESEGLCDTIREKSCYEDLKKKEKVFEFSKRLAMKPFDETRLTIYDGPGSEKYAEYSEGLPEENRVKKVRIGLKEIQAIQAVLEDNVLFETEYMEDPYQSCILDGASYTFFFAVKGRENTMYGSNIEDCREDYEHCMHSAHAIRALEEIREILVPLGVPKKYFKL